MGAFSERKTRSMEAIEGVAGKVAPGRTPHFIEAHVVKAFITISHGPIGRVKLAKALGLGEGAIRTLIRHFDNAKLIETSRKGIVLTDAGKKLVASVETMIPKTMEVPRSVLTVSAFNIAILVRSAVDLVRSGLEQRDAAIKVGAQGATTLVFSNSRLTMPLVKEDVFRDIPKIRERLLSELKPRENDVIVIGSAQDRLTAELGAIAAALETLKKHR